MEQHTINEKKKDEILYRAQKALYYNELLIRQCDSWLSAEEGNKNVLKAIEAKRKEEIRISRRNKVNRVLRFFGMKKQSNMEIVNRKFFNYSF